MIVIHGGYSLWTIYSNTWLFYMVRQEWGTVSPVLNPPPVYLHSAVLLDIPDKGRFYTHTHRDRFYTHTHARTHTQG